MFANLIKLAGYLQSVKPQTSLTVTAEQAQLSPEQFDALVRQWAHKLPADFELIDQRYAKVGEEQFVDAITIYRK
ncbi:hypothetical protein JCM19000A_41150 [Silvimonas sp. JCM 19000]